MANFKPKSNSKKAKGIIRSEIKTYFNAREYGTRSSLDAMKKDADAYNCADAPRVRHSDYQKGAGLVDGGALACYYDDQKKMLRRIYGKSVDDWSGKKTHETYRHLIGREYDAMLREREKRPTATKVKPHATRAPRRK